MPKGDESHKVLGDAPGFKSNSMWFQTLSLSIESLYTKENESVISISRCLMDMLYSCVFSFYKEWGDLAWRQRN